MSSTYSHILIDGNNLARKNFYTHKELSTELNGETLKTGTAFGFLTSIASLSKRWLKEDGSLIIVWDRGYTRKLKLFPDYKKERRENRDEEEYEDFRKQRALLERLLKHTRFSSAFAEGEEADDVMATLALNMLMLSEDFKVLIVSSDRDMHQLVSRRIHQMNISRTGKEQILKPAEIKKAYSVTPKQYLLIQLMCGDKGDGVPGVHLIGPKTALKIIQASSKEELLDFSVSEGQKMPKALIEWLKKKGRDIDEVKKLFGITYNVLKLDVNIPPRALRVKRGRSNEDRLVDMFVELEFMSLIKGRKFREFIA